MSAERDRYLASVHEIIDRSGWMLQGVFDPSGAPGFTYTVGLTGKELPELWLGTLPFSIAGGVLNALARRLVDGEVTLANGAEADVDFSVKFRLRGPCNVDMAEVGTARAAHPLSEVSVWQVLWPDKDGLFPTDIGYDAAGTAPQRLLALA